MFSDRLDAGRRLADHLRPYRDPDVVVLGLPRGGVPVAAMVAEALAAPLDVIVVRKLGVPYQPEVAMGAVGEGGARVVDHELVARAGVTDAEFAAVERAERAEVERRAVALRQDHPSVPLGGKTAIVVDDGVATGATARAAARVARTLGARRVVLAVPVGPSDTARRLGEDFDDVVVAEPRRDFRAVGQFYDRFPQVSDREVVAWLARSRAEAGHRDGASPAVDRDVVVPAGDRRLPGHLVVPEDALGIVLFAHGSGSSRHSPRNRYVAAALNRAGLGTLLFDLLGADEEGDRANVFAIGLLGGRLGAAARWLRGTEVGATLPIGFFGASTGAAAALWAASDPDGDIAAVVSRGGRPDLAGERLPLVQAPTLLVVGGADRQVLELNRAAESAMRCETRIEIVPGAGHLFEEPGALDRVSDLAVAWFTTWFRDRAEAGANVGSGTPIGGGSHGT